jgi:hypothetical protein
MRCATFSNAPPPGDSRIVTIAQLVLFSTQTGDAWLLDPADRLAAWLAHAGERQPVQIEETDTTFAVGWNGRYHIEGPAFVYSDRITGRTITILGYPTEILSRLAQAENFKYFWLELELAYSQRRSSNLPLSSCVSAPWRRSCATLSSRSWSGVHASGDGR